MNMVAVFRIVAIDRNTVFRIAVVIVVKKLLIVRVYVIDSFRGDVLDIGDLRKVIKGRGGDNVINILTVGPGRAREKEKGKYSTIMNSKIT